jgi:hypothetical protein
MWPRGGQLFGPFLFSQSIRLRERGTKKVHIFTGERKQVNKPAGAPAWMPEKIWKPLVKKVGTEKLEDL